MSTSVFTRGSRSDLGCRWGQRRGTLTPGFLLALDGLAMYGMGCATENACNLKGQQVLSGIKIWTHCIDPSSGGPALLSATSSMLSSLFLLKVFL